MAQKPRQRRSFLQRLRPTPLARVALLGGIALHLAGFAFFHISQPKIEPRAPTRPFISYAGESGFDESKAWLEQSALFDSAPLFLPTVWNAGAQVDERAAIEIPELFPGFEGAVSIGDDVLMLAPPVAAVVTDPTELLERQTARWPEPGLSTEAAPSPQKGQGAPAGRVEIRDAASGTLVTTTNLPALPESNVAETLLRPAQFYIQMSPAGLVGPPFMVSGSGNSAVDAGAEAWLRESSVAAGLEPGYYSVTVSY